MQQHGAEGTRTIGWEFLFSWWAKWLAAPPTLVMWLWMTCVCGIFERLMVCDILCRRPRTGTAPR